MIDRGPQSYFVLTPIMEMETNHAADHQLFDSVASSPGQLKIPMSLLGSSAENHVDAKAFSHWLFVSLLLFLPFLIPVLLQFSLSSFLHAFLPFFVNSFLHFFLSSFIPFFGPRIIYIYTCTNTYWDRCQQTTRRSLFLFPSNIERLSCTNRRFGTTQIIWQRMVARLGKGNQIGPNKRLGQIWPDLFVCHFGHAICSCAVNLESNAI